MPRRRARGKQYAGTAGEAGLDAEGWLTVLHIAKKKAPQALNLQGFFRQKAGGLPQANTPAVSCMRAETSPKWCSVSPQVISSWVSVLK